MANNDCSRSGIWTNIEQVSPSERFRFSCDGCGKCCRHVKEAVPVDVLDAYRMAKYLRDSGEDILCTDDFLARYAEPVLLDDCGYFVYMLRSVGEDDACIFLKENRCTVHKEKPRACRLYPFVVNPSPDGKHTYFVSRENNLHFKGPQTSVRNWMKNNFSEEDRIFLQKDFENATVIAKVLHQIPEIEKSRAMLHFLRLKYSEFDLDKPFMEQYNRNNAKLLAILHRLAAGEV